MTRKLDHERAPLLETLAAYAEGGIYPFHTPGHKGGQFAAPEVLAMVGKRGIALDLPAMTATDNTFHPAHCVRKAQALAADLFGAAHSVFLSAGSTLGIATSLLAAAAPGEVVAMPRNVHRSVVSGLILSGAVPKFIPHDVLAECGALGVDVRSLREVLESSPTPSAVLLTRPSYYGLARDLEEISALCRSRRVPLIVDEAHGAHLHFISAPTSPLSALSSGADIVVQSSHKTLGTLVGSALLHIGRGSPIDEARVRDALNFLQTTSPSYLLLASIDATRRWLARDGRRLFDEGVSQAVALEDEIDSLPGLRVLRPERDSRLADHRRDPLRMVINVTGTGWTGYEVEKFLRQEYGVEDEMSDWFNVVYVLSPNDDSGARRRLLEGLHTVSSQPRAGHAADLDAEQLLQPPIPPLAMAPREAALGPKSAVSFRESTGRVCAEMVMFYPPGIPVLMPGEVVTSEIIDVCQRLLSGGAHPYASDPSLATIRVRSA